MENIALAHRPVSFKKHLSKDRSISLYTFLLISGVTSIMTGVIWDISWHMTIGRDSLYSPPHMAIYVGGLVTGLGSIFKLFYTTFKRDIKEKSKCVSFWGMKAPLGTLLCIWGAASMLTSAPFDDWWHNTYGLDVKILSPPHALLFSGIMGIIIGTMVNMLSLQNQSDNHSNSTTLKVLYAYTSALFIAGMYIFIIEFMGKTKMHNPLFYQLGCSVLLMPIIATMRGSKLKYPATAITGLYMAVFLLQLWVFPLIPARPKLAPILNPVTHYVPLFFPLLLIIPGFALDMVFKKINHQSLPLQALISGITFFITFLICQWFFSYFLNAPAARNAFFRADAFPYYLDPNGPYRYGFVPFKDGLFQYYSGFLFAVILAFIFSYIGLIWGNWFRKVQR